MENQSLVIHCPSCGNLAFAVVNDPKWIAEVADEIADELRAGGRMEFVSHQYVRENFKPCTCVEPELQPALFAA